MSGAPSTDAIVIGAGPNGLVAANVLADKGWDVVVLEANAEPGGAVRTGEITAPGFRNDLFSAFYPLAAASPVMASLDLEAHGLTWAHAPAVLAHPLTDRPGAVLSRDLATTAANLELGAPGDGAAWARIVEHWRRVGPAFLASLLSPFPPVRGGLRLARAAGPAGLRDLARLALIPARRFTEEEFTGDNAALLFAGCARHADLTPESAGSALLGWLLMCIGQELGFPVPVGGAQGLTDALVRRVTGLGGELRCGRRVERVTIDDGRATGVVTTDGERITARRAVLADCDATHLYTSMVGLDELPASFRAGLRRMQRSSGVFKIDWALDRPIPWTDPTVAPAGTVHVAEHMDELSLTATQLAIGQVPATPFLLIGQMTTADPTRSPAGTESAWAYTHVPGEVRGDAGGEGITGRWDEDDRRRFVDRMEQRIERHAPGFTDRILARHVMAPNDLEAANANLVGGDISGGTTQLHQQLVFRPVGGLGRAETPIRRLYLASASAHPGGAVHGACGGNAARAAIAHHRLRRR
ncbi:MAG: NAD(P)/FAD-dependent oxidoreductase [Ilumatobacteraceae bacterium]